MSTTRMCIRLVPRPKNDDPDFQSFCNFVTYAQKKFAVLKPSEHGDGCVLIVLPTWQDSTWNLSKLIGNLKVGDYFAWNFVLDYIHDAEKTDLNDYRVGSSDYEQYDANLILRGRMTWSSVAPKQKVEVNSNGVENNSNSGSGDDNEEADNEYSMEVSRSCSRDQNESSSPADSMEISNPIKLEATDDGSKSLKDIGDSASTSATAGSPGRRRKRDEPGTDVNENLVRETRRKSPGKSSSSRSAGVEMLRRQRRFENLDSYSPISPGLKGNKAPVETKRKACSAYSSSSRKRMKRFNATQLFEFTSDDEDVPCKDSSGDCSTTESGSSVKKQKRCGISFAPSEDLAIIAFLDEFKRHNNVGGYKSFEEMAKVKYFKQRGRTFSSLHERFRKKIKPQIRTLLAKNPEMLQRFLKGEKEMRDNPHHRPAPFDDRPPYDWTPKKIP